MDKKWYNRLLLITDFIPPNPDKMEILDVEEQVKTISRLGFNSQHIEVNDVTVGEAGIVFFKSEHAVQKRKDLLKDYRKSYNEYGGNDIIYFNVHWLNGDLASLHPEWFQSDSEGRIIPIPYGSGGYSCINSPFRDWAFSIIRDIGKYGVKGVFLDGPVFSSIGCYCEACISRFEKDYGFRYKPEDMKNNSVFRKVLKFKHSSIAEFVRDARSALKSVNKEAIIYINGLQLGPSTCGRDNRLCMEHQDALLAEGGFLSGDLRVLPIWKPAATAKLLETQAEGKPAIVAVAGRHGGWSRYLLTACETWMTYAMSVANGANVWYGIYDTNRNDERMKTVKEINGFLASNSRYLEGTGSCAKIALVWSTKNANLYQTTTEDWDFVDGRLEAADMLKSDSKKAVNGWIEALQRNHSLFDIIDDYYVEFGDMSKYELVIMPNIACMSMGEIEKVRNYVQNGGNIIATYDTSCYYDSGLPAGRMQLGEIFGIKQTEGSAALPFDHIQVEEGIFTKNIDQPLIPSPGLYLKVVPEEGCKSFMYFREKQPSRYCDLPNITNYPFMTLNEFGKGKAVLFTGNIDSTYDSYRFPEYFTLICNTIESLSTRHIYVAGTIPSLFVNMRSKDNKKVVHLINHTSSGGRPLADIIPLNNLKVGVRCENKPSSVRALRSNIALEFEHTNELTTFTVPEVREYEIVVIE